MSARQRDLTLAMIAFGVVLIAFFGLRAVHAYRRIQVERSAPEKQLHIKETDVELIRDWMTIPYIAKTYGIPDEVLFESLEIPERGNRDKSLAELNLEYYPASGGMLLEKIKSTILTQQLQPRPAIP